MNRRDAIKALMSLPAVATIATAKVEPDDVIVLHCDQVLCVADRERLLKTLNGVWPGRKAVVLDRGLKLSIAKLSVGPHG